jgi:mannose-1-phosphate guanylyltransferase
MRLVITRIDPKLPFDAPQSYDTALRGKNSWSGERFWPLSRKARPKQLLCLSSETQTMLGEAVERLELLIPAERVYVVTGEHLVEPIRAAQTGVPDENVIAEPCKRNTAGCLLYATAHLLASLDIDGDNLSVAVVTADHIIGDADRFRQTVSTCLETVEQESVLATQGIVPTRPETGYGYIQAAIDPAESTPADAIPVYSVVAFHEKPNRDKAEDFLASGDYFWNSGMFFWRVSVFLDALGQARPEMRNAASDMTKAMRANDKGTVTEIFESLDNISIDYALMEHAKNTVVVRADFDWDDVGSWTSLDRTRQHDEAGNVVHGDAVLVDSHDCIVYNDADADAMAVSVVGARDLVVVVSKDGVLVTPKEHAQEVRHAVSELRARGSNQV